MTALAIGRPVLEVFADGADVFVLRRAGAAEIVAFALIVVLGPPLLLWAAELAVGLVSREARRWLHIALLVVLAAILVIGVLDRVGVDSAWVAVIAGAAAGAGFAYAALRVEAVRLWMRYLAAAAPIVLVVFLATPPVSDLLRDGGTPLVAEVEATEPAPVVMIVFDELPTVSLLDGTGAIDRDAFPNFARLADGSTWYRNHTTVSPGTIDSVPALLTGQLPDGSKSVPVASTYPQNLFTLLGATYRLDVTEIITQLCDPALCPEGDAVSSPEVVRSLLGTAGDIWGAIASPGGDDEVSFTVDPLPEDAEADLKLRSFAQRVGTVEAPALHYLHVLMPHGPFHLTPSGASYVAPDPPVGLDVFTWHSEEVGDRARQRHLLQLQYTDALLGEVLDALVASGTYDETLVVVTADHGIAFTEDTRHRGLMEGNEHEIAWTPLLVKAPGQVEGEVSDIEVQTIDVVPTIADILGVEIPWEVDGRSALGAERSSDGERLVVDDEINVLQPTDGPFVVVDSEEAFERVLASGPHGDGEPGLRLYRIGPYGDLVGQTVEEVGVSDRAPVPMSLDEPMRDHDPASGTAPVYVSGTATEAVGGTVAVAVNGVIGAVVGVPADGPDRGALWAIVPEQLLVPGTNHLELFVVEGSPSSPTLHPAGG